MLYSRGKNLLWVTFFTAETDPHQVLTPWQTNMKTNNNKKKLYFYENILNKKLIFKNKLWHSSVLLVSSQTLNIGHLPAFQTLNSSGQLLLS